MFGTNQNLPHEKNLIVTFSFFIHVEVVFIHNLEFSSIFPFLCKQLIEQQFDYHTWVFWGDILSIVTK